MNQKEIDAIFEIAQLSAINWGRTGRPSDYYTDDREAHMAWVARQLKSLGYDTHQVGSSWGILK